MACSACAKKAAARQARMLHQSQRRRHSRNIVNQLVEQVENSADSTVDTPQVEDNSNN